MWNDIWPWLMGFYLLGTVVSFLGLEFYDISDNAAPFVIFFWPVALVRGLWRSFQAWRKS